MKKKKKKREREESGINTQKSTTHQNRLANGKIGRFVSLDRDEAKKTTTVTKINANIFTFYARTQKLYWSPDKLHSGIDGFSEIIAIQKNGARWNRKLSI